MNHPLTDRKCGDIAENLPDYNAETCMRAAADWQLEQVIRYLENHLEFVLWVWSDEFMEQFKKAMRPQEDN